MKKYSVQQNIHLLSKMSESVSMEEITRLVVATPVVAGVSYGLFALISKWLHTHLLLPVVFATSLVGGGVWYAASPAKPTEKDTHAQVTKKQPAMVSLRADQPFHAATMHPGDTIRKKRKIERKEIRMRDSASKATEPMEALEPLPPLPPLPASQVVRETKEIRETRTGGEKTGQTGCGEDDPFLKQLVELLLRQKLMKDKFEFRFELTAHSLVVNGNKAATAVHTEALALYQKTEKKPFHKDSEITMVKNKNRCSVSKSEEDD